MTKMTKEEILNLAERWATSKLILNHNEEYCKVFEKMRKQLEITNDFIKD